MVVEVTHGSTGLFLGRYRNRNDPSEIYIQVPFYIFLLYSIEDFLIFIKIFYNRGCIFQSVWILRQVLLQCADRRESIIR